ncbi:G-protein coupled receptor 22-like [Pecten maximus]|uniref:G-protein coupled receptor 22-like n=1 Tax=Pecten maximus TaxID=6579 RepID=UPI001458B0D5|nr:G-protein coupled receptor 22-like [Pecten maximus]
MGGEVFPASFSVILTILITAQFLLGLILNLGILISSVSQQIFHVKRGNLFVRTLGWIDTFICLTLMPCTFAILIMFPKVNIMLCAFHEGVISMSISATTTCVLFISLDRYGAIVTPTVQRLTHKNFHFANVLICIMSVLGFLLPVMSLCFVTSTDVLTQITPSGVFCRDLLLSASSFYIYEVYFVGLASVSTISTTICYVRIYNIAKKRMKAKAVSNANNEGAKMNGARLVFKLQERKTAWLTLAIVSTFFLSWGPYILIAILQVLLRITLPLEMSRMCLLSLGMCSTVLHPIFYTFLNKKESRHDQLKRIMIEAGRNRLREQQAKEATSTVHSLVHRSISHSISIGVGNKHDLEIFTTCQEHPKIGITDNSTDDVFEDNQSHVNVAGKLFSGRSVKASTHRTGSVSSLSETGATRVSLSSRPSVGHTYMDVQGVHSKNRLPVSRTRSLDISKCPTDTNECFGFTVESNRGHIPLSNYGSGGHIPLSNHDSGEQYTNAAFEH